MEIHKSADSKDSISLINNNGSASETSLNISTSGINNSPEKSYGAAFSLASLDQPNRGSTMNLSFDTAVFLKSGSFSDLNNLLNSQIFKDSGLMEKHLSLTNQNLSTIGSFSNMPALVSAPMLSQNIKSLVPASIPSNVISTSPVQMIQNSQQYIPAYGNNALIQPKETEKRIVERKDDNSKFVDVTPFLTLPQHEAAKKLGIPSSTLAKRWKEASCNRKWPYRTVSKLDKEILTLLKNVENAKAELSPSVEATLGLLLKKRQEELKTVLVRL